MGGIGSGRYGGRHLTSDYRQLDVRELHRAGLLQPGHVGAWHWYQGDELRASIVVEANYYMLTLRYSAKPGGQRESYATPVGLAWTDCTYGGARPWFLCPLCGRRVAILYGGAEFLCRYCRRLAYPAQRATDGGGVIQRVDRIRRRLDWAPGILNGSGAKPKGMHWRTFRRLRAEHDALVQIRLDSMAVQLGSVLRKLGDATAM